MTHLDDAATYHVSDFLKDRHPYSVKDGFLARREEDRVKVFDGYGLPGLRDNIAVLSREDIRSSGKEQALRNILRQLSSQEMKVRLCDLGLPAALSVVASPAGCVSPQCDRLVCLAFRQLAVLPSTMAALYMRDCVPVVVDVLLSESEEDPAAVAAARLAACEALREMAGSWDGRRWLLGEAVPEGFIAAASAPAPPVREADPEKYEEWLQSRKDLGRRVVSCLVRVVSDKAVSQPLLLSALRCLSSLTSNERGLEYALYEAALRDLNQVLERYVKRGDEWVHDEEAADIVRHAATVVWNVAMDDFGKDGAVEVPLVPTTLGLLLHAAVRYPDTLARVKAAITGAIAAIYIKAETKRTGIEPLHDPPQEEGGEQVDIRLLLVKLLKQANRTYETLQAKRKTGEPLEMDDHQAHITDVIKNTNQCIRLLAELPEARKRLRVLLRPEPMEFRRQIFYSTPFEEEMLGFKVDAV
eukprot:TRINITY_DN50484_c0_g1_i1.p2 TRINITY_DN50484_c0_g1~~TRINITY_DN50484_c0_g1_i1.p2  ORF type:complete len:515 (+),score=243.58 TRINITY_DN50484_c0_g1_i1:135-1547(+)